MMEKIQLGLSLTEAEKIALEIESAKSASNGRIHFIDIDHEVPLSEQGPFDIILHKISDHQEGARDGNKASMRLIEQIYKYHKLNPNVIFLDPLETVVRLADRKQMYEIMDMCKFEMNGLNLDVPRWVYIDDLNDIHKTKDFNFPIICKYRSCSLGPKCHNMQLLFHQEQMPQLRLTPCIAQEFVNHDCSMVKIYVFGPHFFVSTRPSVRNFPQDASELAEIETIFFDSHQVAKSQSRSYLNNYQNGYVFRNSLKGDQIIDEDVAKKIIRSLAKQIPFSLLGIDLVLTNDGKTYNLLDVNFLPSFNFIPDRHLLLINIIQEMACNKRFIHYWAS